MNRPTLGIGMRMATAILETERKYQAPTGAQLPDLRNLPHVASQRDGSEITLEATYYDTATHDLARAGITIRHRTGGSDAGWHLKVPFGEQARTSTRTELHLPPGDDLPEEFTELLTARLRGRDLVPVAKITTRRLTRTLTDETGVPLAEIALDHVTARPQPGDSSSPTRWDEIEVELAEGAMDDDHGRELLKAADREMRHNGISRASHRTKLELALELEPPDFSPLSHNPTAGDVVLAYLHDQFEALLHQDLRVRRDEPDSIHRMRVAARRARAALQEFHRLFQGPRTEELINGLRWLGQELGRARDEEVQRDLLLSRVEELPAESVLGPVRATIIEHYAPRLAEAGQNVAATLTSTRYLRLLDTLEAFIAAPPLIADAQQRASTTLPHAVRRSWRRVERRMHAALDLPSGADRDHALHQARKAAKRARYAAEVVAPAAGKAASRSAKALKKVQSTLGDHHDAVIAADTLRHLGIKAHAQGENAYTYGLLHERSKEYARQQEKPADRRWRRARRRKKTAWLR